MAERVGFEPTCRLPDKTLSRRPRYDHFGTSPRSFVLGCARDGRRANISLYRAPPVSEELLDEQATRLLEYTAGDREAMIEARQIEPLQR